MPSEIPGVRLDGSDSKGKKLSNFLTNQPHRQLPNLTNERSERTRKS
jgi:hypothetical protein